MGNEPPGQILLFVAAGRLGSLEYVYFDKPPREWPAADRIRVVRTSRDSHIAVAQCCSGQGMSGAMRCSAVNAGRCIA
jgi:hypothetical protein